MRSLLPFPTSLILLPASLGAAVVYVRLSAFPRSGWPSGARALLLGAIWASPLATEGPGPAQLALGILVAYVGIRGAALAQRVRGRAGVGDGAGAVARELLIPRPMLVERAHPLRHPQRLVLRGVLAMGACVGLLVVGDAVRLWQWSRYADDLLVLVEVAIGAAGMHDTFVGVAALAFGRHVRGLLDRPALSTSLSEFWGRRWNRLVQSDLDRGFFRPLARRGARRRGTMAAFAASGVMHAVAVLDADTWSVTVLPAASVMAFFLVHGALTLGEQAVLSRRARALDESHPHTFDETDHGAAGGLARRQRRLRLFGRRVLTLTVFAALSPLLLDPSASVTHVHGRRFAAPRAFHQIGRPGLMMAASCSTRSGSRRGERLRWR